MLGALPRVKPRSPLLFSITNVGFEFVKPKLCLVFFPRAIAMREASIAWQAATDFGRYCLQMRAHDRGSQTRPSPCAAPQVGVDGNPGDPIIFEIDCLDGRRHLPLFRVRRAA